MDWSAGECVSDLGYNSDVDGKADVDWKAGSDCEACEDTFVFCTVSFDENVVFAGSAVRECGSEDAVILTGSEFFEVRDIER